MQDAKYNFNDRVAFITGGASGIGQATAYAFAHCGATVVITDRDNDRGQMTAKTIQQSGGSATFIACDVGKAEDVKHAITHTINRYGRIDYAFNNAGIEGESATTAECSEANWDRVMAINLKGVWLCMKYQIPEMLKGGRGAIVNCSSIAGLVGFTGSPAYVASKHAINGLTKTAALEYAKFNIRVNAVCPGVIDTPMIDRFTHGRPEAHASLIQSEPVGRIGRPEEIACSVLWLCSNDSSFVTGQTLAVDGGWVAQ